MQPTEILKQEHRVIEQVLACLDKMAAEAAASGRLDTESAGQAIVFFRQFADKCHHGKEEARLFPAMEAKGFSPDCGPTAVMRHEHELGRGRIRNMAEALEQIAAGKSEAVAKFVEHARGYVELLREHINKEDHCLFPMADNALSASEQENLLADFERAEREEVGPGVHEECLSIAKRLGERYGIPCTAQGVVGSEGRGCVH